MTLTYVQRNALKKYADGKPHNEKALHIHGRTYESLQRKGLIKRTAFMVSTITEAGREALK